MKNALRNIVEVAREVFRNGRTLALFFAIYFAMLATLTVFIVTREATIRDVLVTLATLILMPALFFMLQAMCVTYSNADGFRDVIRESVAILRKLVIVSVPFILIGVALYLLLGRIDASLSPPLQGRTLKTLAVEGETWQQVVVSAIRLVLFGIVFPLVCMHVWIAARRHDVRQVLSSIKQILTNAFALNSVKTYVIGFMLFGIIPYLLLVIRTPSERAWLEITMLSVRVVIALSIMLVGWVITVGAMQRTTLEEG